MGVIQRQTLKNNIVSYSAVIVGALAQLFLYSKDLGLKGEADVMLKVVFIIGPLIGFGAQSVMVRFLPYAEGERLEASQQLLTRALALVTLNLVVLTGLNFFFGELLFNWLENAGYSLGILSTHRWSILLLLTPIVYSVMITAHVLNFHRIAIPALFNNLLVKILLPVLFSLVLFQMLSKDLFIPLFIGIYWSILLGLLAYTHSLKILRLTWGRLQLKGKTTKDMISLGGYTLFGGMGAVLALHLDTFFVDTLRGHVSTGIYSFAIFATTVIAIPFKAVNGIASPIVAKAWKEKNMDHLAMLYRETAIVLFTAGGFIYTGLVVCLPYVYQLTDNTAKLTAGFVATVLLGISQLFDQMTSINGTLITFTDNYRWNVVFIAVLGVLNIFLNYYFMVTLDLGINGAALATLTSLVTYNVLKVAFVYRRMGIHPFSFSMVNTIGIIVGAYLIAAYVPLPDGTILNILIRGLIVVAVFYGVVRYTSAVPTIREILKQGLAKVLKS